VDLAVFQVSPWRYCKLRISERPSVGTPQTGVRQAGASRGSAGVDRSQSVGVRCVGRSGTWSGLMWSGSGAGIGLELSETFLNGPEWFQRDLRILCSSSSAHCVGRPWGSRGRRFKSCRPDGMMGGFLTTREPPISLSTCDNAPLDDLASSSE
jgi:hypothetical protein